MGPREMLGLRRFGRPRLVLGPEQRSLRNPVILLCMKEEVRSDLKLDTRHLETAVRHRLERLVDAVSPTVDGVVRDVRTALHARFASLRIPQSAAPVK